VQRKLGSSTYDLGYDAENRLTSVSGAASASFYYDADGHRVKGVVGGVTTVYIGDHFEWTGSTSTMVKYYPAGAQRIAMRKGGTLYDSGSTKVGKLRYARHLHPMPCALHASRCSQDNRSACGVRGGSAYGGTRYSRNFSNDTAPEESQSDRY
jgi:hypothetical protein